MFVGILHSAGVYPFHTVEVDQSAQNWFYRAAASLGEKAHVVFIFIEFFVHFVVQRFADAVFNLFELRDLATAGFPKRTGHKPNAHFGYVNFYKKSGNPI